MAGFLTLERVCFPLAKYLMVVIAFTTSDQSIGKDSLEVVPINLLIHSLHQLKIRSNELARVKNFTSLTRQIMVRQLITNYNHKSAVYVHFYLSVTPRAETTQNIPT